MEEGQINAGLEVLILVEETASQRNSADSHKLDRSALCQLCKFRGMEEPQGKSAFQVGKGPCCTPFI